MLKRRRGNRIEGFGCGLDLSCLENNSHILNAWSARRLPVSKQKSEVVSNKKHIKHHKRITAAYRTL